METENIFSQVASRCGHSWKLIGSQENGKKVNTLEGGDSIFTENMIAPCGIDCSLCSMAHKKENACPGCMGPDVDKPEFCSVRCTIFSANREETMVFGFATNVRIFL